MLTALAMIFSYIEFLIPFSIGSPGIKLGIANIVRIITLYCLGPKYAFAVNIARVLLSGLLFSGLYGLMYSLSGALISLVAMSLLKKTNAFSIIGVSAAGGVTHNFAQILMASLVVSNINIFIYFPVLIFAGIICGVLNGFASHLILKRLPQDALVQNKFNHRGYYANNKK